MAIYLFYGEETYLLETRVKKIKKEFGEQVLGINYIQIDETNVDSLISNLETPAFGFPKKLIIAKNTGLFKKEKKSVSKSSKTGSKKGKQDNENISIQEKIANYLEKNQKEIEQTVDLIFIEQEAEKNSLYEIIEKIGEVKEFTLLKLPELITNLKKICNLYKVTIDENSAKYLVECSGTNMQDLINEVRKLIEYKGEGGNITKEDIDKLCIKQIQAVIFDLTDNLGKKDIQSALNVLRGLIINKEPVQKILVTLYNHFKKLYIIKIAEEYGKNEATAMSLKPNQMFLVTKYKTQAKYFEKQELRGILEELVNLDANSKVRIN